MPVTPPEAAERKWAAMIERHDHHTASHPEVAAGSPEHRPDVAFLACADARVPPEVLFEQAPGSAFVVRIAGNSAISEAVASLTFAVEALGVDLLVVLGHTQCGAVTASFQGGVPPSLASIITPIDDALSASDPLGSIDEAIVANVRHNLVRLRRDHGALGAAIAEGRVALHGTVHDIATGQLHIVDEAPPTT